MLLLPYVVDDMHAYSRAGGRYFMIFIFLSLFAATRVTQVHLHMAVQRGDYPGTILASEFATHPTVGVDFESTSARLEQQCIRQTPSHM